MRKLFTLLFCFVAVSAIAQLPPVLRNAFTTNSSDTASNSIVVAAINDNTIAATNFLNTVNGTGGQLNGGSLTNVDADELGGWTIGDVTNNIATTVNDMLGTFTLTETSTNTRLNITNELDLPYGLSGASTPWPKIETNTYWVSSIFGNDSTAQINNPMRPWAHLGLVTAIASNSTVEVLAGSYNETVQPGSNCLINFQYGTYVKSIGTTNAGNSTNYNWSITGRGVLTNLLCWSDQQLSVKALSVPSILEVNGAGRHKIEVEDDIGVVRLGSASGQGNITNYFIKANGLLGDGTRHFNAYDQSGLGVAYLDLLRQTNGLKFENQSSVFKFTAYVNVRRLTGQIQPYSGNQATVSNSIKVYGGLWRDGQVYNPSNKSKTAANPRLYFETMDITVPSGSNMFYALTEGTACTNFVLFHNVLVNSSTITNGSAGYLITWPDYQTISDLDTYVK